jgi:hypothetical protein
MKLTKYNFAQEKVFQDLGVEKIVVEVMFELLNPMLLILIDLIALVD